MTSIALSGVIGALSYALDIAEGQPPGHAVRSCLIGMRLGAELELSASDRSDLFYALLPKDAGCSANANRAAALGRAPSRFVLTVRVPGFGCSAPVFSAGGRRCRSMAAPF